MKEKNNRRINRLFNAIFNALRQHSIYRRLIVSFLLIIVIPNLIIGYFSFNISSREMDKNITSSSKRILWNIEQTMNEQLKFYEILAYNVYSNSRLTQLLVKCKTLKESNFTEQASDEYEQCKKEIGEILYQLSPKHDINNLQIVTEYDQFTQLDANGIKRGASIKDLSAFVGSESYQRAIDAEGSPVWFNTSRDKGVFVVEPNESSYLGVYVTLLQSISDPSLNQNKELGVLVINVPCNIFLKTVDLQNMYDENEIIFLSGKTGIVSIMNGIYRINRVPDGETLAQIAEEKNGSFVRKIADTDYIFVFHTSNKTGMAITYMAERRKILSSVYAVRNIIIEVALICIFCALVLSYFVTSSISVPLNRLKKTMEKVGGNDPELAHKYVDDRKDEIGVLGSKFNSMMTRIRNLLDNLIDSEVSRKNEEIRRKEAELDALQMQIKPHFMYNTLNFIRWNAMFTENGEGPVSKMIEEFSNLLRFNTLKTNRLVDINEEIEHLNAYVKVIKFKKELNFRLELNLGDDSIRQFKITKLTFQPIVENAIKYGFTGLDSEGVIQINAQISEGDLLIEIRDNGLGMPQDKVDAINNQLLNGVPVDGSIGIKNVNERIRLHFGNAYGLKISSEEGAYTSVRIHIPCVLE